MPHISSLQSIQNGWVIARISQSFHARDTHRIQGLIDFFGSLGLLAKNTVKGSILDPAN